MPVVPISTPDPSELNQYWGRIVYYEKSTEISKKTCTKRKMQLNGGCVSSNYQFGLASEQNPNRIVTTKKIHRIMGDGIRFSCSNDGRVLLRNNMKFAVFVTSGFLDRTSGDNKEGILYKLYPFSTLEVFQYRRFKEPYRKDDDSNENVENSTQGPMNSNMDPEDVLKEMIVLIQQFLNKLCTVKVSFCKGFGEFYPERPKITDCPCWIELRINIAYHIKKDLLKNIANQQEPKVGGDNSDSASD